MNKDTPVCLTDEPFDRSKRLSSVATRLRWLTGVADCGARTSAYDSAPSPFKRR